MIHQLFCTHCTYGTSALERRQGEQAQHVLGYSARASSLTDREKTLKTYRQVERFLNYRLPADTPAQERMKLEAFSPARARRLFYFPASKEMPPIAGQICYRTKDTSTPPRYGSYFAHVLVGDGDSPWNVLTCLQLWDAAWAIEDRPGDIDLAPLADLDSLAGSSIINDEVLLSFLTAECGGALHDPGGVVPNRWRRVPQEKRQQLLEDALAAYLEIPPRSRRENVLLVVEPSLAALIFYGVAALLPAGPIREGFSFSTYEANPDFPSTTLAATVFHSPDADVKPEAYRGRGFVCHTFLDKKTQRRLVYAEYARFMVGKLVHGGWKRAREVLADFQEARPAGGADLAHWPGSRNSCDNVFDPTVPPSEIKRLQGAAAVCLAQHGPPIERFRGGPCKASNHDPGRQAGGAPREHRPRGVLAAGEGYRRRPDGQSLRRGASGRIRPTRDQGRRDRRLCPGKEGIPRRLRLPLDGQSGR